MLSRLRLSSTLRRCGGSRRQGKKHRRQFRHLGRSILRPTAAVRQNSVGAAERKQRGLREKPGHLRERAAPSVERRQRTDRREP